MRHGPSFTMAAHLLRRAEVPKRVGRGDSPSVTPSRGRQPASLVVAALDEEAVAFCQHFGLIVIPGSRRLVRKVSDVAGWRRGE